VALGSYPNHPALLGGLQTWAGYLNDGHTIAGWMLHHLAGAWKQYSQTMDAEDAFGAALRVCGMTPKMGRDIANNPSEMLAFMALLSGHLEEPPAPTEGAR
jgi:hypothetical protein